MAAINYVLNIGNTRTLHGQKIIHTNILARAEDGGLDHGGQSGHACQEILDEGVECAGGHDGGGQHRYGHVI